MTAILNQVLATGALGLLIASAAVVVRRLALSGHRINQLSALMAGVATAGSLYYSEIAGFVPCELCWWQRILMYPIVIVAGAAWAFGLRVRPVILIQSILGLAVSSYHYLLQQFPDLSGEACSVDAPCSAAWVWEYGFVSIPFMAGVSFIVLIVLNTRKEPVS